MTTFPIHTIESAPAPSRAFLEGLQKEIGFVPNLAASMAESPSLIEGFTTVRSILGRSTFTPLEREVISLAVSFENDCTYCMAAHSTFATMCGASEELLEAMRAGDAPRDRRLGALATYTRHLLTNRGHLTEDAGCALLDAGFTRAQLLDTILVIAFTTIANYAHNVTKCELDSKFEPQRWSHAASLGSPVLETHLPGAASAMR
jgi:uncharacterized peroxidase-related enzyme